MNFMFVILSEIALLTVALAESKELLGPDNHQQELGKEDFDSGIELKPKLIQFLPEELKQKEELHQHATMLKQLEQTDLEKLRMEQEKRRQEEQRQEEEWQEKQRHLMELLQKQQQQYAAMMNHVELQNMETLWKKWLEKRQRYRPEHQQQMEDRPQEHRQEKHDVEGDGFCGTKHLGK